MSCAKHFADGSKLISTSSAFSMPKKAAKSKSKPEGEDAAKAADSDSVISKSKDGSVKVQILAKPGAKHNSITGIEAEGVGVQIAAPPVEGEANVELIKYLSKVLSVRKSDVSLERGSKSRNKIILVGGGLDMEQVRTALLKEIDIS